MGLTMRATEDREVGLERRMKEYDKRRSRREGGRFVPTVRISQHRRYICVVSVRILRDQSPGSS